MTERQRKKCHAIIHSASLGASGAAAGLAQLPLADIPAITAIQTAMITSLGKVFGKDLTETMATSILTSAVASTAGRGISQVLLGWIPGLGNAINAGTAATVTETVGWNAVNILDD